MKRRIFTILLCAALICPVAIANTGKPFFHNITALEYKGHNRNFAVECDNMGNVFVANFEGLLVYDGYNWEMYHTPAISRITSLYKAKDGRIWFGGSNVIGVTENTKDSLKIKFIASDQDRKVQFGEVSAIYEKGKYIYFTAMGYTYKLVGTKFIRLGKAAETTHLRRQLIIKEQGVTVNIIENKGLNFSKSNLTQQYTLTTDDGLCSNNINGIAYNGKGNIWGVTDNGIFMVCLSPVYSHYTESDGLIGQVTSIQKYGKHIIAGTLQGLFLLKDDNLFHQIGGLTQACWQLSNINGNIIAATADGIYSYNGTLNRLTSRHALSTIKERNGDLLIGELDGIYRHNGKGVDTKIADAPDIVKFTNAANGGIWGISLNRKTYYMAPHTDTFVEKHNDNISLLFNYTDSQEHHWHSGHNGLGLFSEQNTEIARQWCKPLSQYQIQTMYSDEKTAWIGGVFGIICLDLNGMKTIKPYRQKTFIRYSRYSNDMIEFVPASDKKDPIGKTLYSYRLHEDGKWSKWADDNDFQFTNLTSGDYEFTARSIDAYGNIAESSTIEFEVPTPIYSKWYAWMLYFAILAIIVFAIMRWRLKRSLKEKIRLEALVKERTQELEEANKQIVRQEKELTVGKLTKGLIDRILNPMNYINNFANLSIGLIKDLKENIDEDKEKMTPDIYDDTLDIVEMMTTNLDKIQQHGLSTTRILKAMEELLKERSGNIRQNDIIPICQQSLDLFQKYCENDIKAWNISVKFQKSENSIIANVIAEQLNKVLIYILANSIFAVKKRADKLKAQSNTEDYVPIICVNVEKDENNMPQISIYDNGIGIEDNIKDKIFDPFFTTKPTAEASGIGLYLTHQVIQDMNGSISMKSEKDKFTKFIITLQAGNDK